MTMHTGSAPTPARGTEMTDRDIIDRIDELVDDQLSRYPQRTGYDHNANVQTCPHCDEEWHGLPITVLMRDMRARFCGCHTCESELSEYRSADDTTPTWCPGSAFIGPWATPTQLERIREGWGNTDLGKLAEWARDYDGPPFDHGGVISAGNTQMFQVGVPEREFTAEQIDNIRRVWEQFSTSVTTAIDQVRTQVDELTNTMRPLLGDTTDQSPQQRALPRPSHEPPMWTSNPTSTRRTRNR